MLQVTAVREDELDLSTGVALKYGVCLWSAGNCSRDITRQVFEQLEGAAAFRAPRPPMQKLPVDNHMRVIGCQNVYAAGDCSRIVAAPLPPTAQVRPAWWGVRMQDVCCVTTCMFCSGGMHVRGGIMQGERVGSTSVKA